MFVFHCTVNNYFQYIYIKLHYTRNNFCVCKQKCFSINEVPNVVKSVPEVIDKELLTGGQLFKKCKGVLHII